MALSLGSLTQNRDPHVALHGTRSNEKDTYLMPAYNKAYKPIFLQHTRRLFQCYQAEKVRMCRCVPNNDFE